jgi:hypothetical protein
MARDGFREGVNVAYASGSDHYGYIALRFVDQAAALDYLAVHVGSLCTVAFPVHPIAGLAGFSYLRNDYLAKAVIVVGDTEVQLDICSCVEVRNRVDLASRWATAIAKQFEAIR